VPSVLILPRIISVAIAEAQVRATLAAHGEAFERQAQQLTRPFYSQNLAAAAQNDKNDDDDTKDYKRSRELRLTPGEHAQVEQSRIFEEANKVEDATRTLTQPLRWLAGRRITTRRAFIRARILGYDLRVPSFKRHLSTFEHLAFGIEQLRRADV